jgi:hypothetical protein
MDQSLSPADAGFDGAKGFRMRPNGENLQIRLKRGKTPPSDHPDYDFNEQLFWFYPDDKPARLLWCNENDQWFELSFNPIQKP